MIDTMKMSDIDYLRLACKFVDRSHDAWTQNGAALVYPDGSATVATNRIPEQILAMLADGAYAIVSRRPIKASWIEHAERAVIHEAARAGLKTEGATMFCPWFACVDCARAIIAAGVERVVGHIACRIHTPDRWLESIAMADSLFERAGVETEFIGERIGVTLRFDGTNLEI